MQKHYHFVPGFWPKAEKISSFVPIYNGIHLSKGKGTDETTHICTTTANTQCVHMGHTACVSLSRELTSPNANCFHSRQMIFRVKVVSMSSRKGLERPKEEKKHHKINKTNKKWRCEQGRLPTLKASPSVLWDRIRILQQWRLPHYSSSNTRPLNEHSEWTVIIGSRQAMSSMAII